MAATLCSKTPSTGFYPEDGKEYAEMWTGDYPVLPAKTLKISEGLHAIIDENKEELLGKINIEIFGGIAPILQKLCLVMLSASSKSQARQWLQILLIARASPLQIHPTRTCQRNYTGSIQRNPQIRTGNRGLP